MFRILLFILLLGPRTAYSNDVKPHEVDGKAEAHHKPVDPAPVVKDPTQPISTIHHSYSEHEPPKPKRSDPQWWSIGVNGIIALTTVGTLLYLRGQIRAMRNTERAFLIPVFENIVHRNPEVENALHHCFQWNFKNCGKTPAFLREVVGQMIVIDSLERLPQKPDYSKFVTFKGDPLIAGERMIRNFYAAIDDKRDFDTIEKEYRGGERILFVYGMVRYDDMFRQRHETRFGARFKISPYSISQDEFVIDGPDSYNQYT
ncbi:MAG TPA: hypothetical protein VK638_33965 [Edaphobacter sp.]|nr:hypothetical protein [Edaphobacter sp.]